MLQNGHGQCHALHCLRKMARATNVSRVTFLKNHGLLEKCHGEKNTDLAGNFFLHKKRIHSILLIATYLLSKVFLREKKGYTDFYLG